MRIGIDARFLGASSYGLAQYSENLLTALAQQDPENDYTVFVSGGFKRKLKVGRNFDVEPVRGRPLSAKGLTRLGLTLRRSDFDLLHVHFPLVPLGARCPAIITVHDIVPFSPSDGHGLKLWDRIGGWFLYPMTMIRARWILCVSNATRQRLVEIFPDVFHKTIVVPSGVEELYRKKTEPETDALIRERLRLPAKYVLYSGSAGASKNVPSMIQAFAELGHRDSRAMDVHFLLDIIDEKKYVAEIESLIARTGLSFRARVLHGLNAEERHVLFEGASTLFMASRNEGFGFPVIRAQLCGVPVVAADAGALPEVCGEGGLLVDPDNAEEMVTMLGRALLDDDLREYLKEKGLKNAARFSWTATAKQVKQIYELLF